MLFRPQRCAVVDGRLLAGDRDTLDGLNRDGGLGEIGRLLAEAGAPLRSSTLEVLGDDNAVAYFAQAERRRFLLALGGEVARDIGHGLRLTLAPARSAPAALARLLERWVARLTGVEVRIRPLPRIDDTKWRWHVGLDAAATALLNDLYAGHDLDDEQRRRIVALFRLDFVNPADARAEHADLPVWLGAATDAAGVLRLKPQNLLTNLPLADRN
jgi:hypothetical protein